MLAYIGRRGMGRLGGLGDVQAILQQAYQSMAAAASRYPDIVAHGGMALSATSNPTTRAAERVVAGVNPGEAQMEEAATGASFNGTGWEELYAATSAGSAYPLASRGSVFNPERYTLERWWDGPYGPHPAGSPNSLSTSLDWAAQNNAKVQVVTASKPGQSIPPNPQQGSVPATGSGASVHVDTTPTSTDQTPAATGFDWSSLLSGNNLLIGGAVLVGLVLVMGMGRGK
jgi:hypothetical protein